MIYSIRRRYLDINRQKWGVTNIRIPLCPPELKACISRKTPKYRLFCYLYETVTTAILQLRVKKNSYFSHVFTRNSHEE